MNINLTKKPVGPTVIEGFPGFGLVGTIAAEFLIEHLKCEKIGQYYFDDLPATIAIHNEKVIAPVEIHYNKKSNIVIIHSISGAQGTEWKAADMVLDICKQLKAKELISLEGVASATPGDTTRVFYNTNSKKSAERLKKAKVEPLKEGIIMGVTSAILVKTRIPTTCIFAETHSALPDSKAAAKVIETIDGYMGLNVDIKPLIKQAEKFEQKLQGLMRQSKAAEREMDKKQMSYVG